MSAVPNHIRLVQIEGPEWEGVPIPSFLPLSDSGAGNPPDK